MNGFPRPRISVLTPAYNAGLYIADCIRSVAGQKGDFEHVIVDDGSTDDTAEIVKSFRDRRIRYVFQKNAGPSAARNSAIRRSRGEFIVMVDADDCLADRALSRKAAFLRKNEEAALVIGNSVLMTDGGNFTSRAQVNLMFRRMGFEQFLGYLIRDRDIPDNQPMWRAARIKRLGGYKEVVGEDIELLLSALLRGFKFGFIDEITGIYRVSPGSITRGGQWDRLLARGYQRSMWIHHADEIRNHLICPAAVPVLAANVRVREKSRELVLLAAPGSSKTKVTLRIPEGGDEILRLIDGDRTIGKIRRMAGRLDRPRGWIVDFLFSLYVGRFLNLSWAGKRRKRPWIAR